MTQSDIDRIAATAFRCMHKLLDFAEARHEPDRHGYCGRRVCARPRRCRRPGRCTMLLPKPPAGVGRPPQLG